MRISHIRLLREEEVRDYCRLPLRTPEVKITMIRYSLLRVAFVCRGTTERLEEILWSVFR